MKKVIIFAIIAVLILTGCTKFQEVDIIEETSAPDIEATYEAQTTPTAETPAETEQTGIFETYSRDELLSDFNRMKNTIERSHPKLYTDHDELNRLYLSVENAITDGMTKLEFLRLVSPIIGALNCGHTRLYYMDDTADVLRFADRIYPVQEKLYLRDNTLYSDIPLGSQIVSINGRTAKEIIDAMTGSLSSDGQNLTNIYYAMTYWFSTMYLNYVEYAQEFDIAYITPDGKSENAVVPAYTYNEIRQQRTYNFDEYVPHSVVYEADYAILQMEDFYPFEQYTIAVYKSFIDEFFMEVKDRGIENVILDVRNNGGGDPVVTAHLFSYLETEPNPYWVEDVPDYYPGLKDPIPMAENHFDGDLYILINGGCGSSTGHLLALLKYQEAGIIIGEESGASFACTDSSQNYTLLNTGLTLRYSTQVWQVDAEGLEAGRGIMPDYEIIPTIDEIINDTDPVLEFAVDLAMDTEN